MDRRRRGRVTLPAAAVVVALAWTARDGAAVTVHVAPPQPGAPRGDGSIERPFRDLAQAVAVAAALAAHAPADEIATVALAPGDYLLTPHDEIEETCGNCADPATPVPFTLGLRVSGRRVHLEGSTEAPSVLRTRAGYGVLVQDCEECVLRRLVITDGVRDTSGLATDAAIVVQRSSVRIEECLIQGNLGEAARIEKTIVGIIGVAGREGAKIDLHRNRIERNSWDGVALYRDAEAEITGNIIDGVDLALGREVGGGRGVGIGLTWNARAVIRGNLVRRYWKGIGLFVDADATVEENIVESIATWGLSLWDAEQGRPRGFFRHNAVDSTGACGAMISRAAGAQKGRAGGADNPGCLIENLFSRTGQNPKYDSGEPYCEQTSIARHAVPAPFRIEENLLFANREPGDAPGSADLGEAEFRERAFPVLSRLESWETLRESRLIPRMREDGR